MTVPQVRILVGDNASDPADYYLKNEDYQSLLDLASGNVYAAAANGLRAIAVSQALLYKKVQVEGLEVDGPDLAEALRKLAKDFDALSADEDALAIILTDIGVM